MRRTEEDGTAYSRRFPRHGHQMREYSCVGHGGGSGYLAAMAMVSVAPDVMKPTALMLNILVASIGSLSLRRLLAIVLVIAGVKLLVI